MADDEKTPRAAEKQHMQDPEEASTSMQDEPVVSPHAYYKVIMPPLESIRQRDVDAIKAIFEAAGNDDDIRRTVKKIADAVPIISQYSLAEWDLEGPLTLDAKTQIKKLDTQRKNASDEVKPIYTGYITTWKEKQAGLEMYHKRAKLQVSERNFHLALALVPNQEPSNSEHYRESLLWIGIYATHAFKSLSHDLQPEKIQDRIADIHNDLRRDAKKYDSINLPTNDQGRLAWSGSLEDSVKHLFLDLSEGDINKIAALDATEEEARILFIAARRAVDRFTYHDYLQTTYRPFMVMKSMLEAEVARETLTPVEKQQLKTILLTLSNGKELKKDFEELQKINLPRDENNIVRRHFWMVRDLAEVLYRCSVDALRSFMDEHGQPIPLKETIANLVEKYPLVFNPPPQYAQDSIKSDHKTIDAESSGEDGLHAPLYTDSIGDKGKLGQASSSTAPAMPMLGESSAPRPSTPVSNAMLVPYEEKRVPDKMLRPVPLIKNGKLRVPWKGPEHAEQEIKDANVKAHRSEANLPRLMRLGDIAGPLSVDNIFHEGKSFFLASAQLESGEKVTVILMHEEFQKRISLTVAQVVNYIKRCELGSKTPSYKFTIKKVQEASITSASSTKSKKMPGL